MKSWPAVFPLLAMLLGVAGPAALAQEPAARPELEWLNRFRSARGLAALGEPAAEPALQRAADAYAAVLASSGRLAHRDAEGRSALERYRAAGGSAARVGEILGAGPGLSAVTAAWEASPAHAAAALDSRWTHAAAGRAQGAGTGYWVVLFAEQLVEGFQLTLEPGGTFRISGIFRDPRAAGPELWSGLQVVPPEAWDPARREFLFLLPSGAGRRYHRLGYRTGTGEFFLTSAFYPYILSRNGHPDQRHAAGQHLADRLGQADAAHHQGGVLVVQHRVVVVVAGVGAGQLEQVRGQQRGVELPGRLGHGVGEGRHALGQLPLLRGRQQLGAELPAAEAFGALGELAQHAGDAGPRVLQVGPGGAREGNRLVGVEHHVLVGGGGQQVVVQGAQGDLLRACRGGPRPPPPAPWRGSAPRPAFPNRPPARRRPRPCPRATSSCPCPPAR